MSAPPAHRTREKRKRPVEAEASEPRKKVIQAPSTQNARSLRGPHEATVSALQAKYDVVVASVISSTQIRKRVELALRQLAVSESSTTAAPGKKRIVLLHARTAQVCKMITIVEQCKRILAKEGTAWYQYNQLFDLPTEQRKSDAVEEAILEKDKEELDDEFEVMSSRFEKAVLPDPPKRLTKSMRIFLSTQPIPELAAQDGVTIQTTQAPER